MEEDMSQLRIMSDGLTKVGIRYRAGKAAKELHKLENALVTSTDIQIVGLEVSEQTDVDRTFW